VLVPALVSWHPDHARLRTILSQVAAVPAHVLLETFSVLTRLPAPHRVAAGAAAEVVSSLPLPAVALPGSEHHALIAALGPAGIRGGATYDALIAATARHHQLHLLTRDRRARTAYDAVGLAYSLV
jgi:predicted nucleic acid-binding protein